MDNYIKLLGVKISLYDKEDILNHIKNNIEKNKKALISNVNIHAMNIAHINKRFFNLLKDSSLTFNDSYGIRLAAKITSQDIPPRNTPPDWIDDLAKFCIKNNYSMYFIGGESDISNKVALKLQKQFPDLKILGTDHGYYNKLKSSKENKEVLSRINAKKPNILIVGFGMPMQEFWIEDNFDDIEANVFLPVGAFFDYVSGEKNRNSKLITDNGLEWLARLMAEPKRMGKRYILGNPLFFYRVILEKLGIKNYIY